MAMAVTDDSRLEEEARHHHLQARVRVPGSWAQVRAWASACTHMRLHGLARTHLHARGEAGAAALAPALKHMGNLKELRLRDNGLGQAGSAGARAHACPRAMLLRARGCVWALAGGGASASFRAHQ